MTKTKLKKLIEKIVKEALEEVNAISSGNGSMQSTEHIVGTNSTSIEKNMSDDEKEIQNITDEINLDEFNAVGTGAIVGYTLPLGMKPDYEALGTANKKKKSPRRWYNPQIREELEEEFIGKRGSVSYFQIGGSLPDTLYNRTKDGKPTQNPGVAGLKRDNKRKK